MARLRSQRTSSKAPMESAESRLARHGLSLPWEILRACDNAGIYCFPGISVEHQHFAHRFVLKGTESGGATENLGRYCGFVDNEGQPIPWLQPLDSFGGNGRHAIVIAENLVRIEMLRIDRTYELAITRHSLTMPVTGGRPRIASSLLFRGRSGVMAAAAALNADEDGSGTTIPLFHTNSGEKHAIPAKFVATVCSVTNAVVCRRCKHAHVAIPPKP
ncbi:hypothetical protein [Edaphobacter dinghuensis]|uniref:Uncharacterized protein n=1 Tax=Edaphobacter dinghuensis TaxID=1560005 RepID=A0A917M9X5_9BACT|nr:hypothetical protein [Edaphobacter dinghuensis]GGG87122.1 hypothetical protein GCM10011585_33930 [Edaphobacter dinghuensis]